MRKYVVRAASIIGACALIATVNTESRNIDVDPQSSNYVSENKTKDTTMAELMRYEFMQSEKQKNYSMFESTLALEVDKTLQSKITASEEYAKEVDLLREKKVALENQQIAEADQSFNELMNALNNLNDAVNTISVAVNDVPVVASGQNESGQTSDLELTQSALIAGDRVDENYSGSQVVLDSANRELLEALVMGEAGDQGFIGAALVAQTIHDTMIKDNNYDVNSIRIQHAYSGTIDKQPNEDVKSAVAYIFDKGGMAVQHRLIYFYAPRLVSSSFHESQKFIVSYKGHKFFDNWE